MQQLIDGGLLLFAQAGTVAAAGLATLRRSLVAQARAKDNLESSPDRHLQCPFELPDPPPPPAEADRSNIKTLPMALAGSATFTCAGEATLAIA